MQSTKRTVKKEEKSESKTKTKTHRALLEVARAAVSNFVRAMQVLLCCTTTILSTAITAVIDTALFKCT